MIWRLWGIRHVRYWWHCHRVHAFAARMGEMGLGLGDPNPYDLRVLEGIWRGLE